MSIGVRAHGVLPCPFCGSGAINVSALFCHCVSCGATGPVTGFAGDALPPLAEKRASWNRRAAPADAGPGFWYLATSYSKHPDGLAAAFAMAIRAKGVLLAAGIRAFSPIIHSHPVAMLCNLDPMDHALWMPDDEPLMAAARGLIVLRDGGWEESKGVSMEIAAFQAAGKSILYMDPGRVPAGAAL